MNGRGGVVVVEGAQESRVWANWSITRLRTRIKIRKDQQQLASAKITEGESDHQL